MKTRSKFLVFLRKNLFYFILGLCIIAIALSITLVLLLKDKANHTLEVPIEQDEPINSGDDEPEPTNPTVKEIEFCTPVENGTVSKEYCETLMYNSTLDRYEDHQSIDFKAEDGASVYAVYDGVIKDVVTNYLTGTTITIDHGNELITVYSSLLDGTTVTKGQTVKQGDKIGEASNTNLKQLDQGTHLNFQVIEKGVKINPMKYLQIEEK